MTYQDQTHTEVTTYDKITKKGSQIILQVVFDSFGHFFPFPEAVLDYYYGDNMNMSNPLYVSVELPDGGVSGCVDERLIRLAIAN